MEWPEFIFDIKASVLQSGEKLSALLDTIEEQKLPPFLIFPEEKESKSIKTLKDNGCLPVMQWFGMLLTLSEGRMLQQGANVAIKQVRTTEKLEKWINLANQNLFFNKGIKVEWLSTLLSDKNISFFSAEIENEIVGTTLTFQQGSTVGIYMVSTSKEHRGKGIMKALINHVIGTSKELAIKNIVLEANSFSYMSYKKLGFEHICNFNIFWKQ